MQLSHIMGPNGGDKFPYKGGKLFVALVIPWETVLILLLFTVIAALVNRTIFFILSGALLLDTEMAFYSPGWPIFKKSAAFLLQG